MKLTKEQKQEIADQQAQKYTTKRVTSPELEKILYEAIPVLDHGFVRVIDYMGDDSSIVQSARVSYGKGTKKVSTDEGLIKYLMRHWHSTTFEMCEIKYHVKLPILLHGNGYDIEPLTLMSTQLDIRFWIKSFIFLQKSNFQPNQLPIAKVEETWFREQADEVLKILKDDATRTYDNYEKMLNERYDGTTNEGKAGLARELARMNLTLNSGTNGIGKQIY